MSLLPRIAAYLRDRNVPCALIGGDALAVHGVPRATIDHDLVLLKMYAGGPQDTWDIQRLLAASDSNARLREEVEADVGVLPRRCIDLWKQLSHL